MRRTVPASSDYRRLLKYEYQGKRPSIALKKAFQNLPSLLRLTTIPFIV